MISKGLAFSGCDPHQQQPDRVGNRQAHIGEDLGGFVLHLPIDAMRQTADSLRVAIKPYDVRRAEEVDVAFASLNGHVDGLVVFPEGLLWTHRRQVVDNARAARLPTIFGYRDAAEIGGLMSYGPDLVDLFMRGASYVDKIIRASKPADLPIQQPTKFELVINLDTARALRLSIPPSLLARADQTIG